MKADVTGVGIAIGLVGTAIYSGIVAVRHKRFRASASATVFLGLFAMPIGVVLIRAALEGDAALLPTSWREYVAIAGVVGLGLAIEGTGRAFRDAKARPGNLRGAGDEAPPDDQTAA